MLESYRKKRNFSKTDEPKDNERPTERLGRLFVIHHHFASREHFDLRLEHEGVLKSWAVPKGMPKNGKETRLAIRTEDHPIAYVDFEGTIPEGEYGAGEIHIDDEGIWQPLTDPEDLEKEGKLKFRLYGKNGTHDYTIAQDSKDEKNWYLRKTKSADIGKKLQGIDKAPSPQLATLSDRVPKDSEDRLNEVKYDGYRLIAVIKKNKVKFYTRKGLDYTDKFPQAAKELERANFGDAVIDGEMVVFDDDGVSQFNLLQGALKESDSDSIHFMVFDALSVGNTDLRDEPQILRKEALRVLFDESESDHVHYARHYRADTAKHHENACKKGLEGLISKDPEAPYKHTRTRSWLKVKCQSRDEFVVLGYTPPGGSRKGFGALLVGVKTGGDWKYVGRIGTGFSDDELNDLKSKFDSIQRKTPPAEVPKKFVKEATWVTPKIVIEASFRGWTSDGYLRHAAYEGLRKDKEPDEVRGEESEKSKDVLESGIEITHPEREIFPKSDITKLELARYYEEVADRMLPHVANRPLSLVRCPEGAQKDCFYQRNYDDGFPDAVHGMADPENKDNTLIYVKDRDGVVALIQMGVIEMHPWGARTDKLEKPDTCIFDLDPGEGVEWDQLVKVAETCRDFLKDCGLKPFAKTSGSKGIHVVVPLIPHADWDQLKEFGEKAVKIIAGEADEDVEVKMTKSKRKGKVFLDRFRNRRSSTSVAAYSARAKPQGPVSMPVPWTMLPKLKEATAFKVADYEKWLKAGDPWSDYDDSRERLTKNLLESLD